MVTENKREILGRILELIDTACQASLELLSLYTGGQLESSLALLTDLGGVVQTVSSAQKTLVSELEHAYTSEMLINIEDTLDDIRCSIQRGDSERAAMKMELQLFPFLRQLKEAFYFWGMIYPDPEEMTRYYQEEFAAHYRNFYVDGEHSPRYRASVVVVAYNHLEITKRCVESILKYTNFEKLNAQLILVDHGSSDGVLEYFEGLGVGQVIHYKANMRGIMFCALPQICDSEYYVHVANDTVVTKDWLEILLNCADSAPNIAVVVPATCNISNYQAENVPVSDCAALVKLAEGHNRINPRFWNDRARVLPAIGLFQLSILNKIGFWDPLFYTFDFMDDDFSLRARRYGCRQILCEDVMCYHQGSATVGDVQAKENTLEEGRRLFLKKHGVDAWGNGAFYDFYGIQQFQFPATPNRSVSILGIDCGFGDTALQICNQFRRKGSEGSIYHVTTDGHYLPDLQPQARETLYTPIEELLPALTDCFSGIRFDTVFLGQGLESYPDPYCLLETLSRRTASGGQLVFFFSNPYFALRLYQMLQFSIPDSPLRLLHPEQVGEKARLHFSSVVLTSITQSIQGLEEFIVQHYGRDFLKSTQRSRLEISRYYVRCVK